MCSTHEIVTTNGHILSASGIGSIRPFSKVLCVPKLTANLLSVGQPVEQNCLVIFSPNGCVIKKILTGKTMARGRKVGRLFLLQSTNSKLHQCFLSASKKDIEFLDKMWNLWHLRLGHPHSSHLNFMLKSCILLDKRSLILPPKLPCESCARSKSNKLPFQLSNSTYSTPFDLICSDVWGPSPDISRLRYKYFILFIDQASRYTWFSF